MNLSTQKRLAGSILKCSPQRVKFNPEGLDQIKEAITRSDIKNLINRNVIVKENIKGISRVRANKIKVQKSKGRRKGPGSQKGTTNATIPRKRLWINKIRLQRSFIRELNDKDLISQENYRILIRRAKGGAFRSKRHLKLYIEGNHMFNKKE